MLKNRYFYQKVSKSSPVPTKKSFEVNAIKKKISRIKNYSGCILIFRSIENLRRKKKNNCKGTIKKNT